MLEYIRQGGESGFRVKLHEALLAPLQVETLQGVAEETKTQSIVGPPHSVSGTKRGQSSVVIRRTIGGSRSNECIFSYGVKAKWHSSVSFSNSVHRLGWRRPTSSAPQFDEDVDWRGAASLVAGVELVSGSGQLEESVASTRVVVMGDIDWVSNGMLEDIPSNALFAEVLLNWLMDTSETSISKYRTPTKILITKPQLSVLRVLLLVPLPLLIAIGGFLSWRRRR